MLVASQRRVIPMRSAEHVQSRVRAKVESLVGWRSRLLLIGKSMGVVLVLAVGGMAVWSSAGYVKLPYELFVLQQRLPAVFRIHMAASGLALILITVTLLLRGRPNLHRQVGRFAGVCVVIGGLTALPSAIMSEATLVARTGFFAQGCVWLGLFGAGIVAIRAGRPIGHQRIMLAMAAVASGAIWLRFATMLCGVLQLPFDLVYASTAWLSWLAPMGIVWLLFAMHDARPRASHAGR